MTQPSNSNRETATTIEGAALVLEFRKKQFDPCGGLNT